MKTYADALATVSRARDIDAGRPLRGRATRLVLLPSGSVAVRYQSTDVVIFNPDETITLNSGGYRTLTTKARINEWSPARIWQAKGLWSVSAMPVAVPFRDGMRVDWAGCPLPSESRSDPHGMTYEEAFGYVSKLSSAYVRAFIAAGIQAGGIPQASGDEDGHPCCQTIDGLLYWLASGLPNEDILTCALSAQCGDPYFVTSMIESDFSLGRTPDIAAIRMRAWLRARRHVLACELSGQPIDAGEFAAYFRGDRA